MKKFFWSLLALSLILVAAIPALTQDAPLRLEITGINATQLPTVTVTANVYDSLGQPITGLAAESFAITGEVAAVGGRIVRVENVTDNNLNFSTVLLIDVSSSMEGQPIAQARAAARAFVENIGANDPVAVMTFGRNITLVQPFTTDKTQLLNVIDSLQAAGETALYQGAYEAVNLAAESGNSRRAVVLLSDGAEYGGNSRVGRAAALEQAQQRGVPVYSIGLGFGTDRTYLQELAQGTNARFIESPTPDELVEIYTNLATQFRSQYVLTLDVPVPGDGTEYTVMLQVTTDAGTASATGSFRAPIPIPIVDPITVPDVIDAPITITPVVRADDPIESLAYQLGDGELNLLDLATPSFTIDPFDFPPGALELSVVASDADGEVGSAGVTLNIAALPPIITTEPDLATLGTITEPVAFTLNVTGQTPIELPVVEAVNGVPTDTAIDELPYNGIIDPYLFNVGENTLSYIAITEADTTATATYTLDIAALPPIVSVSGITDGQSIDQVTVFSLNASAQDQTITLSASIDGEAITVADDGVTFAVDPLAFTPGAKTLTVTATTNYGLTTTVTRDILIAALPPVINVDGLTPGETISADRPITAEITSQTGIVRVTFLVDGEVLAEETQTPYTALIRVLEYAPGEHTLTITAENASEQSASRDIPFVIAPEPAATATATAVMAQATQAAQATNIQATAQQATAFIVATQAAVATDVQATADQGTAFVAETQSAIDTATQNAEFDVATQAVQATATQVAAFNVTAEAQLQATQAVVQATTDAEQLETQQSVQATRDQATDEAVQLQATQIAQATASQTAEQATADAEQLETQQVQATATRAVILATQTAVMAETAAVQQTATQVRFNLTATQFVRETAQVFAVATATADARDSLATRNAQARIDATATADIRATQTAEQAAQRTQTALERTEVAETAAVQQTVAALAQTATEIVNEATQTAEQVAVEATRDAVATQTAEQALVEATRAAVSTALAQTATEAARATETAEQAALNATATREAMRLTATALGLEATQTAEVRAQTQTARAAIEQATQAAQTATARVQLTQAAAALAAQATENRQAELTMTAARALTREAEIMTATQIVINATATAQSMTATRAARDAESTRDSLLATEEQATAAAQATQTANAQATADTAATRQQETETARQTAVGPTPTEATPDAGAQVAQVPTDEGSPTPTASITPTLIPEELETEQPPLVSNDLILPLIIVIVVIVVVIILVLVGRRRR